MESPQPYQYRPIVENDGIRLLDLEPNPDLEARIECSLIHTTLHEYDQDIINHYTALSYVWGDTTTLQHILVNGHEFHITFNLHTALRYMRDPHRKCLIWADAICINQSDDEEKNRQVRQMGNVYRNATHTIIFLGEPTENSDTVLGAVESSTTSIVVGEAREALPWHDVLDRPWFQRVWVYQELIFSRDPWLQCGRARVRWTMLHKAVKTLKHANRHVHPWKEILKMEEGKQRFENKPDEPALGFVFNLLSILDDRRGLGVLDARDMLFAHCGILGRPPGDDQQRKLVDVDYTKDYIDVYRNIVRYTLPITKDYRILAYAEANPSNERSTPIASSIPTWIPNWSQKKPLDPTNLLRDVVTCMRNEESMSSNVSLDKWETDLNDYQGANPWFLTSDRLLLGVTGTQVGTLCIVSDLVTKQDVSLRLEPGCMKEGQYAHGTRKALESVIFHHWKGLLDFLMSIQPSDPSSPGGGRQPKLKEEIHSCITQMEVESLTDKPWQVIPLGKWERLIRHLILHAVYEESTEYLHFLCGRRFGKLQNGRLVLVPGRAKVGDRICFFQGDFTVPFLLRAYHPLNGANEVDDELRTVHGVKPSTRICHFEFVGECLIDELVRRPAERVESVLKVKLVPEVFVLH